MRLADPGGLRQPDLTPGLVPQVPRLRDPDLVQTACVPVRPLANGLDEVRVLP